MRRVFGIVSALCAAVGIFSTARADDVFGGLYAHAVFEAHGREDDSFDTMLGYDTGPIKALGLIGKPEVHTMIAINDKYSTDFVAVGLDWRVRLSRHFYFRPGLGLAYTTGKADAAPVNAPGLTPAEIDARLHIYNTRIDFGDHVLFEPTFGLGYIINPKWRIEASYIHLSNGQILHQGRNEGLDDVGLRLMYQFH